MLATSQSVHAEHPEIHPTREYRISGVFRLLLRFLARWLDAFAYSFDNRCASSAQRAETVHERFCRQAKGGQVFSASRRHGAGRLSSPGPTWRNGAHSMDTDLAIRRSSVPR